MTLLFDSGELPDVARRMIEGIRSSGHFDAMQDDWQVTAVVEECGEFVKAYRRWKGQARQSGTREEMEDELADVIITAFATAYVFDMDINSVIERKVLEIFHRGWKGPSQS